MKIKFLTVLSILLAIGFSSNVFAEDQVPGMVVAVEGDPFYFSENNFGLKILKYFERPLNHYLVDGVTNEQSSIEEIISAYDESTREKSQSLIVSDDFRAQSLRVTFFGAEIQDNQTFDSFLKFEHLEAKRTYDPRISYYYDITQEGFALESLPSKDKESYYNLLAEYVNPGRQPERFDATIDLITGSGSILQFWEYKDCSPNNFDYFLQDNLLYFTMTGKKAASELRDNSKFECVIFSVNFGEQEKIYSDLPDAVQKYEDRAILYLYRVSGGEYEKVHSTGMISKFSSKDTVSDEIDLLVSSSSLRNLITNDISDSLKIENFGHVKFMGESLPSKFSETTYTTVERYINPGKQPEPFDIRVDVMTGDGTILYSGDYDECTGEKFAIYLNDGIVSIKFHPSLKYEFRDRFQVDCVVVNALVMPQDYLRVTIGTNLSVINPVVQQDIGVSSDEVVYKEGMCLMFRSPINPAICVFDEHVDKLENHGWIAGENQPKQISPKLKPIIPTDQERAQRISVHFQEPDITPTQQLDAFSKFSPIDSQNLPLLILEHNFDNEESLIFLESLPSDDKIWLYDLLSGYTNPEKDSTI